jgi:hypothetical protein
MFTSLFIFGPDRDALHQASPEEMSHLIFASYRQARDPSLHIPTVGVTRGVIAQETKHKKPNKKDHDSVNRDFE